MAKITYIQHDGSEQTVDGLPDPGIAIGSAFSNYGVINISPPIEMAIGERFAVSFASSQACSLLSVPGTDQYHGGDAYQASGGGWVTLLSTDTKYDLPGVRSLITPAQPVVYSNNIGRSTHSATLLGTAPASKVLVFGGSGTNATAELYNPQTGFMTTSVQAVTGGRNAHVAVLLPNGKVLIAGGRDNNSNRLSSAELFERTPNSARAQ